MLVRTRPLPRWLRMSPLTLAISVEPSGLLMVPANRMSGAAEACVLRISSSVGPKLWRMLNSNGVGSPAGPVTLSTWMLTCGLAVVLTGAMLLICRSLADWLVSVTRP